MLCATCGKAIERATTCPECKGVAELRGEYVLHEVLGRGANGVTYRAERIPDGHVVAVKEMPVGTMDSVKAMELFDREAKVLRQLSHRAIPKYEADFAFGIGKATALYLVQELVDGRTLAEESATKRYTEREVLAIVAEIAGVLAYLHALSPPVVHRDIKPANVMRRKDGSLCLIDFGSVREAMKAKGGSTVAGTFGYMAPEQLAGRASAASDVYSLGALAVALLAREEPDTMLDDDHELDWESHVEVGDGVADLLTDMLARDPSDRVSSAKEVAARATALAATGAGHEREERKVPPARGEKDQVPFTRQRPGDATDRARRMHEEEARTTRAERRAAEKHRHRPATNTEAIAARAKNRTVILVGVAVTAVTIAAGVGWVASRSHASATLAAVADAAPPDVYARPLAVDVNGDGVEDVVQVVGVDTGKGSHDPDTVDTFGQTDGRFTPHVQAVDGATGKPIYSLAGLGESFASNPSLEGKMPRTVLAAIGKRLLVVHVRPDETVVDGLELATGKRVQSATFEPVSGRACLRDGKLVLPRRGAGTVVVDATTLARGAEPSGEPCPPGSATATVADAPDPSASSKSPLEARFSLPAKVKAGTYGGTAAIASGGRLAFVHEPSSKAAVPQNGPSVSFSSGGGSVGGRDNTQIRLVVVDEATGATIVAPSLADLGLPSETVSHLAFVGKDVLVVLAGAFVRVGDDGKTKWNLAMPAKTRALSYAISGDRAYVHVVEDDNVLYGFLSKKMRSRTLVLDLAKGAWLRSIPEGPLAPAPPPPRYEPSFEAVTGCACAKTDTTPRTALFFGTSSTLETGGKKFYGAHFAFDVDGARKVLAPYTQRRERIAPPRTLEGMVPLAMACGEGHVVFAHDTIATAWELESGKEAWTVELPRSRGERPTTLGGGATLKCDLGTIERGLVKLPALDGAPIVVKLADGAATAASADAGAPSSKGVDAGKR